MRNDPPVFSVENKSPVKEPHYVVEIAFDASASSLWYFTSHNNTGDAEKNLLTYSEEFETSSWVKGYTTVSANVTALYAGASYIGDQVDINRLVTNLLTRTEELSNASAWYQPNVGITDNSASAPFSGPLIADTIYETATDAYHFIGTTVPTNFGKGWQHQTAFVKAKERDKVALQVWSSTTHQAYAIFDLTNSTIAEYPTGGELITSMASVGDGWFRCDIAYMNSLQDEALCYIYLVNASSQLSYLGDGSSGIYVTYLQATPYRTNDDYVYSSSVISTASVDHVGEWYIEQTTQLNSVLAGNTFTGHAKAFTSSETPAVFKVMLSDRYEIESSSTIFTIVGTKQYGSAISINFSGVSTTEIKHRIVFASTSATNYLHYTKIDTTVGWTKVFFGVSVTVNGAYSPDGTQNALLVKKEPNSNAGIITNTGVSTRVNDVFTFDAWAQVVSGTIASSDIYTVIDQTVSGTVSYNIGHLIGSEWTRIPITYQRSSTATSQTIYFGVDTNSASFKYALWTAQVVDGTEIKSYVSASSIVPVTANSPKLYLDNAQLNAGGSLNPYYHVSSKTELIPTETYEGTIQGITGTTQRLDTLKSTSTIGAIRVNLIDEDGDITNLIYSKLALGYGLRGKRLRVYAGFSGYSFSDYQLIQTQIIDSIDFKENIYTINCADIQRIERQDIFTLEKTTLASTCTSSATTVRVFDITGFEMMAHGASFTDAQSSTVGYIKIEDEIIAYSSITTAGSVYHFIQCRRGALNTKPAHHEYDATLTSDRQKEVEEFVYLELPAPKLAYALLTGNLINQTGETLPSTWNMHVASSYVTKANFTGIGNDLWDYDTGDTNGLILRFAGVSEVDGKRFIEEQIYRAMGCYSPVYADGTIGLRRMTSVMSDAPSVATLNHSNITRINNIKHDMRSVRNSYAIDWNYNFLTEKFTRRNLIIDAQSISRHGDVPTYIMEFEGMHGSRHTFNTMAWLFDALRDRYSSPPIELSVEALPSQNDIEVGDIINVQSSAIRDYTTNETLNRSFEVENVTTDWITGRVRFQLMGASEKASPFQATQQDYALTTAFYSGAGTDLCTTYGSAYFSTIGGVVHLTSSLSVNGSTTLASSIFYCLNDLTIDTGKTLSITKNFQLRVMGFLTINGDIDGHNTGTDSDSSDGTYGHTKAYGGTRVAGGVLGINSVFNCVDGGKNDGLDGIPVFNLDYNGSYTINGLPSDLRGKAGKKGGDVSLDQNMQISIYGPPVVLPAGLLQAGASGGNGGSGLLLINRGMSFGVNGNINLSGEDGTSGTQYVWPCIPNAPGSACVEYPKLWSGDGGGGASGAVLVILDGKDATSPSFTTNTFSAKRGASNFNATRIFEAPYGLLADNKFHFDEDLLGYTGFRFHTDWGSFYTGYSSAQSNLALSRIMYLEPPASAESDPNDLILSPPINVYVSSGSEHLYINTDGTVVTRMHVTWDTPSVTNIAGYEIQYQLASTAIDWYNIPPVIGATASAAYIEMVQDSIAYDVRVRSASNDKRSSIWAYASEHTVVGKTGNPSDVTNFTYSLGHDLNIILSWDAITDADVSHYELRFGGSSWETATYLGEVRGTTFRTELDFATSQTYRIKAIDTSGNYSTNATEAVLGRSDVTVNNINYTIIDGAWIKLTWTGVPASLEIRQYEVRYGRYYDSSTFLGFAYDERFDITESSYLGSGAQYYWVNAIDEAGNFGVSKKININIAPSDRPSITFSVIDNFILLKWDSTPQTFEINYYEILKGPVLETAESVGTVSGKFTTLFESQSGTYRYWVRARDKAGNWSLEQYIDAVINQPPDYVLHDIFDSVWSGTYQNCMIDVNGITLVYPVNTSITIASAISTAWATPASAITAGYEYWIQPSKTTMMYSEIFDIGSDLGSSQLTIDYTETVIDGVVSTWTNVLTRVTTTDSWATVVTSSVNAFATDFRYVKVDFHASTNGDGQDLAKIENFKLRLDSKLRTDSGTGYVSTPASGAYVPFDLDFADIIAINVTPQASTAVFSVYDFVDTPNPSSFTAYLFTDTGAAASGPFSWTARGF